MKITWKCLRYKALYFLLLLPALSCTNVHFERPVPKSGAELRSIPAGWAGTYVTTPQEEDGSLFGQIFRECYRLERLGETKLLVSSELRIHEKDMPRLKKALEGEKRDGKLLDYRLSEGFVLCTIRSPQEEGQPDLVEQQYTALIKKGSWYILANTVTPFRLFDLDAGIQTEFEHKKAEIAKVEWLPGADSISAKTLRLVARHLQKGYYFNTQPEEGAKWALLYVTQPSKDTLIVKVSNLEDQNEFERRQDYFNAITPFRKTDNNKYEIDPTDEALARLLAEEHLFQTMYMARIE